MTEKEKKIAALIAEIKESIPPEFAEKVKKSYTPEQMKYLTTVFLLELGNKKRENNPELDAEIKKEHKRRVELKKSGKNKKKQEEKDPSKPQKWEPEKIEDKKEEKEEPLTMKNKNKIDIRI